MKVYFTCSDAGYIISKEEPFSAIEIKINITRIPQMFSFVEKGGDKEYGMLIANTDAKSITNVIEAIKHYPGYHFNMIEEVLREAGVDASSPNIEYIYF